MKKTTRNEALELRLSRFYTGKPCRRGHISERYTVSDSCVECTKQQNTPERVAWRNMIARCHLPTHPNYHNYGARGITVCRAWREDFNNFVVDVGLRPSPNVTLHRVNNEKGYEPGNVLWTSRHIQSRNKRTNQWIILDGREVVLADAAKLLGVRPATIRLRAQRLGCSFQTIVNELARKRKPQ